MVNVSARPVLRHHVTQIARRTGQDPLTVLSVFAAKLADNPAALAEVHAEMDARLSGTAYREFD